MVRQNRSQSVSNNRSRPNFKHEHHRHIACCRSVCTFLIARHHRQTVVTRRVSNESLHMSLTFLRASTQCRSSAGEFLHLKLCTSTLEARVGGKEVLEHAGIPHTCLAKAIEGQFHHQATPSWLSRRGVQYILDREPSSVNSVWAPAGLFLKGYGGC